MEDCDQGGFWVLFIDEGIQMIKNALQSGKFVEI
jgi:hypothetical protein